MTIKELKDFAEGYNDKLLATDERFTNWVHVIHQDGSTFLFNGAFIFKIDGNVNFIVFTEHFGYHIFYNDDVVSKHQFEVRKK